MNFTQKWYITDMIGVFKSRRQAGKEWLSPPFDYSMLSYHTSGKTIIRTKKDIITVKKGDIVFIPPYQTYRQQTLEGDELIHIHLRTNRSLSQKPVVIHFGDDMNISNLFTAARNIHKQQNIGSTQMCMSQTYAIFAQIEMVLNRERIGVDAHPLLGEAENYMHAHYTNPDLTVEILAEKLSCSGTYLRKLFTNHLHTTPSNYLRSLRIAHASELLTSGYYSISEVAHMSGYIDEKNFSTAYKKATGLSPSQVKKRKGLL